MTVSPGDPLGLILHFLQISPRISTFLLCNCVSHQVNAKIRVSSLLIYSISDKQSEAQASPEAYGWGDDVHTGVS